MSESVSTDLCYHMAPQAECDVSVSVTVTSVSYLMFFHFSRKPVSSLPLLKRKHESNNVSHR